MPLHIRDTERVHNSEKKIRTCIGGKKTTLFLKIKKKKSGLPTKSHLTFSDFINTLLTADFGGFFPTY